MAPEPDQAGQETQPQVVIMFDRWSVQAAFTAWVASGDCARQFWQWMSWNGWHV